MTTQVTFVYGPNAAGKTRYAEQLLRTRRDAQTARYVAFADAYGGATDRLYYAQLRWNQHDIPDDIPTVADILDRYYAMSGDDTEQRRTMRQQIAERLDLTQLRSRYVVSLSSGELRRLHLAKALMAKPTLLIIDNPLIGLDANTRKAFAQLLFDVADSYNTELTIIVSKESELQLLMQQYKGEANVVSINPDSEPEADRTPDAAIDAGTALRADMTTPAVDISHVTITYGDKQILSDVSWKVMPGEKWALTGRNGSGKSTLLSLIVGDNPQAYACDIRLFGRRKGSGETIWDIKRKIGYVSPEMHRSYNKPIRVEKVVASGFRDSCGLYVRATESELQQTRQWMETMGIGHLDGRIFTKISSGEQRLALLARAFVKNPQLLILDEPFHGLDEANIQRVNSIICRYTEQRPDCALIVVSHYMDELPQCISNVYDLSRREIPKNT